tara:strand:- start:2 stop:439 length:438 start_codon:yes stop_codon:yes gene_type:complete
VRKYKNRKKQNMNELDITSLLDILIILLVFLLKSYNPNSFKTHLADPLTPPSLNDYSKGKKVLSLQVNEKKNVFINEKKIGALGLSGTREKIRTSLMGSIKESKGSGEGINIIIDKKIFYKDVKVLMGIVKKVGIKKMRFIVRGA